MGSGRDWPPLGATGCPGAGHLRLVRLVTRGTRWRLAPDLVCCSGASSSCASAVAWRQALDLLRETEARGFEGRWQGRLVSAFTCNMLASPHSQRLQEGRDDGNCRETQKANITGNRMVALPRAKQTKQRRSSGLTILRLADFGQGPVTALQGHNCLAAHCKVRKDLPSEVPFHLQCGARTRTGASN